MPQPATLAATNKCLARSNKTRTGAYATKKRNLRVPQTWTATMKKLPGDYDLKSAVAGPAPRGWSRARLIAMDQRYCEVMRAAWGARPAASAIRADKQETKTWPERRTMYGLPIRAARGMPASSPIAIVRTEAKFCIPVHNEPITSLQTRRGYTWQIKSRD